MKTTTILKALELANMDADWGDRTSPIRERQATKFRAALLSRMEAGDRALFALQMAARAYYSGNDEMLGYILKGET